MGTLKSSGANLTINADGSGNDIKFQSNGSEVASIDQSGNLALNGTVDGRDIATDGTKLDGIEASADVTDATNVTAAGALMDSEVTNLAQVKAFDSSAYATAAQGTTADNALPKAGGAMTGNITHADSVKAIYGTGSDMEIYHDGSDSYIVDTGTGNMVIKTDGNFYVQKESGSENMIRADVDGAVSLFHDNSKALSTHGNGADVHGSAAYSQLTFKDSDGNVDGYAHGESGAIGFKDGDADWSFKCNNGADFNWYVNGNEKMRLESDADLHVDGDVIAYSTTISDATLKYDINPVEFALDKINQLKGVSYKYKHNDRESAGLLAQDVEKVMPSAVNTKKLPLATGDDKEYKTLHYDSMTAILVEAIKELTEKVKKLEGK